MDLKRKWKEVKGYEGRYIVSNYGEIISLPRYKNNHNQLQYVEPKDMIPHVNNKNGYVYVMLYKDTEEKNIRLHRIVAEAFIPNPNNLPQVNHIDGNKQNNRVDNLEWCTGSKNIKHAYKTGLRKPRTKKIIQYDKNGKTIKEFESLTQASKETGISMAELSNCINGKYKYKKKKERFAWIKE